MNKLYYGDEIFNLFKQCYYKYCLYSEKQLKRTREELYEKMQYANDYYGINVKTLSRLEHMNYQYKNHKDKFNSNFWFEVFIKEIGIPRDILLRNGIKFYNNMQYIITKEELEKWIHKCKTDQK